jgi:hypothetical protein
MDPEDWGECAMAASVLSFWLVAVKVLELPLVHSGMRQFQQQKTDI